MILNWLDMSIIQHLLAKWRFNMQTDDTIFIYASGMFFIFAVIAYLMSLYDKNMYPKYMRQSRMEWLTSCLMCMSYIFLMISIICFIKGWA